MKFIATLVALQFAATCAAYAQETPGTAAKAFEVDVDTVGVMPLLIHNANVAESRRETAWPSRIQAVLPSVIQNVEQKYIVSVPAKGLNMTAVEVRNRIVPVTQANAYSFNVEQVTFKDVNGKEVDLQRAIESIKKHRAFILPQTDSPVKSSILKLFNKELIQVIPKPPERPAG